MELPLSQILQLARISILAAIRDESALEKELVDAVKSIDGRTIREAILQAYLFAGYAATINAFIVMNRVSPAAEDSFFRENARNDWQGWKERGVDLCRQIYGDQFEKLVANMQSLHPDLADWMIAEGYGKVLSRPFLSPRIRELLIVSMTAALRVERQFHSHTRGALNVGATSEEIMRVVEEAVRFIDPETGRKFLSLAAQIIGK